MQLVQRMPEVEHSIVLLCKLHIVKGVIVTSNVPGAVNMEEGVYQSCTLTQSLLTDSCQY